MAHFVGLDVSVKETSVCVVDDAGKVLCERKVPTEPDDIAVLLTSIGGDYVRVGIEAGPLSQWLMSGLAEAGAPSGARAASSGEGGRTGSESTESPPQRARSSSPPGAGHAQGQ